VHDRLVRPDARVRLAQRGGAGWRLARGGGPRVAFGPPGVAGAVEDAHVLVPVQLHQPQAQGGRVPVEHHRGVRADPRARDEGLQRGAVHGAVAGVLQVGVDVPEHGAVDVPVVVGGRADVDLNDPYPRVIQVSAQPSPVRQYPAGSRRRPGHGLICCCLHGNLPEIAVAFEDSSTAGSLSPGCQDVGETLAEPRRARLGPIRSKQATVRTGRGWPGRGDAELLAQALAELGVSTEGLGQVVLGGQRPHQVAVPALAQRGQPGELPPGPDGRGQLGPAQAQPGGGVTLQGTQPQLGELVADLVDPGCVLTGQEAPFRDEQRGQRRPPRPPPVLLGDRGLGPVDGLGCGLQVDPDSGQA
jgi:hypothetical protein